MNPRDMKLSDVISDVIFSIPTKIHEVLSSVWGWFITAGVFCSTFLGDRLPLLVYISVAILIDALWGIKTAVAAKKFIFSKLITKSAVKIAAYVSVYAIVALIEKGFAEGFMVSSSIIAAVLIASELWSVLGHIGIAYPDFVAIQILKKYLKGEMSKKLGVSEEELDEILNKRKNESQGDNTEVK